MKMLNIGCGNSFHRDWINIDFNSDNDLIIKHDIKKGLPFADGSFNVIYCSHVLEHFNPDVGEKVINEIFRVLQNGGIARILVPDLETICKNYLKYLEEAIAGDKSAEFKYDYSLLELFDQMIRTEGGGRMGRLWNSGNIPDINFVLERNGIEAKQNIKNTDQVESQTYRKNLSESILVKIFRKCSHIMSNYKIKIPETTVRLFLGKEYVGYFRESIFRSKGEIHKFMYDRYSLPKLLKKCGFKETRQCEAGETGIPDFAKYQLEIINGIIRKPDSIYIEAVK